MKIPDVGWIKSVGITDANGSRYLTFDPSIKVEPGDFLAVSRRCTKTQLICLVLVQPGVAEPKVASDENSKKAVLNQKSVGGQEGNCHAAKMAGCKACWHSFLGAL